MDIETFFEELGQKVPDQKGKELVVDVLEQYLTQNGMPQNTQYTPYFYDGIGFVFFKTGRYRIAAECFEEAFSTIDPYQSERAKMAYNLADAVQHHWEELAYPVPPEEQNWLEEKRPLLEAAVGCINHFKNQLLWEEGYSLAQNLLLEKDDKDNYKNWREGKFDKWAALHKEWVAATNTLKIVSVI